MSCYVMSDYSMSDNSKFESDYSDSEFWNKIKHYSKKIGEKVLEPALKLYYAAKDPDVPFWAKTTIYGALGYFISPIDAIPDVVPFMGYTDDLGVLAAAAATVAAHIKSEHAQKAKETLQQWFG